MARQIYLEACLIDPCALDWDHLRDEELRQMRKELAEDVQQDGGDDILSLQWLPSLAYARGLFLPKRVRLRDEFGALVEQYLELRKRRLRVPSPEHDACLFLMGIVLCDNEPFLRLIKGIDFAEVRREMKRANPPLFAAYLKRIEKRAHRLI